MTPAKIARNERDRKLRESYQAGVPAEDLATRLQISRSLVFRVVQGIVPIQSSEPKPARRIEIDAAALSELRMIKAEMEAHLYPLYRPKWTLLVEQIV